MKFLTPLFVLMAYLSIINTDAQSSKCTEKGGTCVFKKSSRGVCAALPFSCGTGKVCCKGKKGADSDAKRKCLKTPGKCLKEGGLCVAKKKTSNCSTAKVDALCKGESCSCCVGEKESCNRLPACKIRGGICMNALYDYSCPRADKAACAGPKCSCCYIRRSCSCGVANGPRIVGGETVSPKHKYPWMAIISDPRVLGLLICGASIINDLYLVTAAHCVFDPFGDVVKPRKIAVGVGLYNRVKNRDNYVDVQEIIVHEKFDPFENNYDIALLKLKEPLDFSANREIRPVCLPLNPDNTYEGELATVTGWGVTDYGDSNSLSNTLQEVSVPILSPECEGNLPNDFQIKKNMLCAGYTQGGKDSCKGDSGGPLFVKEGDTHTLVGLVSFGSGCADRNVPGVYTRVSRFIDWISNNTIDANYCS